MLKELVYDGQFPDLKVCPDCWDPKHPQEYLPSVTDPTTLYDPTGDQDRAQANSLVISWPRPYPLGLQPLQIGFGIGPVTTVFESFDSGGFSQTSFSITSFSITSFDL